MKQRQQSSTNYPVTFLMRDSADHLTGKAGLTPTVTLSKNGGVFGAASGAVSEIGNGWYALAGDADDRDTLGDLLLHATSAGADPADERFVIVLVDPFSDTVKLAATQGAVTFGQMKILASAANEGALHIVNSAVGASKGIYISGPYGLYLNGPSGGGLYAIGAYGAQIIGTSGSGLSLAGTPGLEGASEGSGAIEWVYTLTSSVDGAAIPDAEVWVTSDATGLTLLASGRTDASGQVTFWLDAAAAVYVWRQCAGWNFTNPDTETVA